MILMTESTIPEHVTANGNADLIQIFKDINKMEAFVDVVFSCETYITYKIFKVRIN